jgi:hypothetical protein
MPIRTICVKVAEVLEGGTKSEFYSELRKSLDLTVQIANLSMSQCVKQDDLTQDKAPKLYTYPEIVRRGLTENASQIASSICRAVEKNYKQDRWMVARGKKAIRSFRSQPLPLLHNKSNKTVILTDEREFLTARIKLVSKWFTVRLAGGEGYRDQIRGIRKAMDLNGIGDSKIWIDAKHHAIIGLSCELPASDGRNKSGTMTVSSSRESLLIATFERSSVPFVINADIIHTWKSRTNHKYQRLRQDRKSDANRKEIRQCMNSIAESMSRKMKTLCHEVSSRIVNKAIRSNVAEIKVDLTIKSYSKSFPWFDLASKIKYKAESAGIVVIDATQSLSEPDLCKPHVYFKFAPITNRIKIGMTVREDGGRHGSETDSSEDLVVLSIDNQPKSKVKSREKHFHAMFQEHRLTKQFGSKTEWFVAEPVLAWLREVDWLGNAGNLSQIAQVLDVSKDAVLAGHLKANGECLSGIVSERCSQNADKRRDISGQLELPLQ